MKKISSNKASTLILTDEPIKFDRRVINTTLKYKKIKIVNIKKFLHSSTKGIRVSAYFYFLCILLLSLPKVISFWVKLSSKYNIPNNSLSRGLYGSLKGFSNANHFIEKYINKCDGIRLIHAHSLLCAVIGLRLARKKGIELVYDAHEVEFCRHRDSSLLRMSFDFVLESQVIEYAKEVRVVNKVIAELYKTIYPKINGRIKIISNAYFKSRFSKSSVKNKHNISIVYVGSGIKGRMLEQLNSSSKKFNFHIHAFFLKDVPQFAIKSDWHLGSKDYQLKLEALRSSTRCVMWCCNEIKSLSYRLSTPNKLYQALALGMPVIASKGTYLSDIVQENNIGFIFEKDDDMQNIIRRINSDEYDVISKNCRYLQTKIEKNQALF